MAARICAVPATAQMGTGVVTCSNCSTEPTQRTIELMHDLEYAKQLVLVGYLVGRSAFRK
jgi:hypothetical protein